MKRRAGRELHRAAEHRQQHKLERINYNSKYSIYLPRLKGDEVPEDSPDKKTVADAGRIRQERLPAEHRKVSEGGYEDLDRR